MRHCRRQKEYRGIKSNQARRLKEPKKENARLKKAPADAVLDKAILEEALEARY